MKDSTVDDYLRIEKTSIDMIKCFLATERGDESIYDLKMDVEYEESLLHANLTYLNKETIMNFANVLASNI